jgi:hypothetical protein
VVTLVNIHLRMIYRQEKNTFLCVVFNNNSESVPYVVIYRQEKNTFLCVVFNNNSESVPYVVTFVKYISIF